MLFQNVKFKRTFPLQIGIKTCILKRNLVKISREKHSYHDYKLAWSNTFYFRDFDHSWFFHFHKGQMNFPIMFYEWFSIFVPTHEILTPQVHEGFQCFQITSTILASQFNIQIFRSIFYPMNCLLGLCFY